MNEEIATNPLFQKPSKQCMESGLSTEGKGSLQTEKDIIRVYREMQKEGEPNIDAQ